MVNSLLNYLLCDYPQRRAVFGLVTAIVLLGAGPARAQEAAHGMVVSAQREASAAGLDILKAGGNAVDAAVAVGYALAVVDPCCGNIGGGGFLVAHLQNGTNVFVNFREKAPLQASRNMYLQKPANATDLG